MSSQELSSDYQKYDEFTETRIQFESNPDVMLELLRLFDRYLTAYKAGGKHEVAIDIMNCSSNKADE